MSEKFTKENDYTISVVRENDDRYTHGGYDAVYKENSLTRTFNFKSAQVTTVLRDRIFQSRNTDAGGAAAVANQIVIQNFNDIQSHEEIKLMHQKLIELGGTPPELPEVLPILDKGPMLRQQLKS